MNRVREQIGCEAAFKRGITGKNVGIGVLDSGVFLHPDIKNRVAGFKDFVYGGILPYDDSGHGTFVCGVLSGSGAMSDGRYRGIAPDAKLYVGKVLEKNGDGDYDRLIEGLEWLLENKESFQLKVINISVGSKKNTEKDKITQREEAVSRLIEKAYKMDVIVVTAAGNFGPASGSLSVLGEGRYAVSVGCHDGEYKFANTIMCEDYSGRGPTRFLMKKPDIVAPGTEIVSCGLNGYTTKSGTSMATPLVSGAVALAYERFPKKTVREMIQKLTYSARDLKEPWNKQGWGMLDIRKFLQA